MRESPENVTTDVVGDPPKGRWLTATWGGGSFTRELPSAGTVTIGRVGEADVVIDDSSVSRVHARLLIGDTIQVEDLGSSNGTWVDGQKVGPGGIIMARPGAVIELGRVLVVVRDATTRPAHLETTAGDEALVVSDPEMIRVHELIELVARTKLSVVLLGETGVGKEVLAARLHERSPRAAKPFWRINCAAVVESLFEAEVFGYERGAFTGAAQAKPGLLELADQGTLFLDELGETPLTTQAKLLRVLESGFVTRIGGVRPIGIDVRFVSATNQDLAHRIEVGRFRQDLFFRLDGFSIRIPPLRERPSDLETLTRAFIRSGCAEIGRSPLAITDEAMRKLRDHRWPGNVRELKNAIMRGVLLCKAAALAPEDLSFEPIGGSSAPAALAAAEPQKAAPPNDERSRILAALAESGGNQTRAAKLLGLSRRTLLHRLDELGVPRPRKADDGK